MTYLIQIANEWLDVVIGNSVSLQIPYITASIEITLGIVLTAIAGVTTVIGLIVKFMHS